MKLSIILLAIVSLGSCKTRNQIHSLRQNGVPPGQFNGYAGIDRIIRERMLDATDDTTRQFQVHLTGGSAISSISDLLGGFSADGERRNYLNGDPNPLSLLLWHSILASFAESLGNFCGAAEGSRDINTKQFFPDGGAGSDVVLKASTTFAQRFRKICNLNADATQRRTDADEFWHSIVSYETPAAEFEEWYTFFLKDATGDADARERTTEAMLGLFLNPHFLLSR